MDQEKGIFYTGALLGAMYSGKVGQEVRDAASNAFIRQFGKRKEGE